MMQQQSELLQQQFQKQLEIQKQQLEQEFKMKQIQLNNQLIFPQSMSNSASQPEPYSFNNQLNLEQQLNNTVNSGQNSQPLSNNNNNYSQHTDDLLNITANTQQNSAEQQQQLQLEQFQPDNTKNDNNGVVNTQINSKKPPKTQIIYKQIPIQSSKSNKKHRSTSSQKSLENYIKSQQNYEQEIQEFELTEQQINQNTNQEQNNDNQNQKIQDFEELKYQQLQTIYQQPKENITDNSLLISQNSYQNEIDLNKINTINNQKNKDQNVNLINQNNNNLSKEQQQPLITDINAHNNDSFILTHSSQVSNNNNNDYNNQNQYKDQGQVEQNNQQQFQDQNQEQQKLQDQYNNQYFKQEQNIQQYQYQDKDEIYSNNIINEDLEHNESYFMEQQIQQQKLQQQEEINKIRQQKQQNIKYVSPQTSNQKQHKFSPIIFNSADSSISHIHPTDIELSQNKSFQDSALYMFPHQSKSSPNQLSQEDFYKQMQQQNRNRNKHISYSQMLEQQYKQYNQKSKDTINTVKVFKTQESQSPTQSPISQRKLNQQKLLQTSSGEDLSPLQYNYQNAQKQQQQKQFKEQQLQQQQEQFNQYNNNIFIQEDEREQDNQFSSSQSSNYHSRQPSHINSNKSRHSRQQSVNQAIMQDQNIKSPINNQLQQNNNLQEQQQKNQQFQKQKKQIQKQNNENFSMLEEQENEGDEEEDQTFDPNQYNPSLNTLEKDEIQHQQYYQEEYNKINRKKNNNKQQIQQQQQNESQENLEQYEGMSDLEIKMMQKLKQKIVVKDENTIKISPPKMFKNVPKNKNPKDIKNQQSSNNQLIKPQYISPQQSQSRYLKQSNSGQKVFYNPVIQPQPIEFSPINVSFNKLVDQEYLQQLNKQEQEIYLKDIKKQWERQQKIFKEQQKKFQKEQQKLLENFQKQSELQQRQWELKQRKVQDKLNSSKNNTSRDNQRQRSAKKQLSLAPNSQKFSYLKKSLNKKQNTVPNSNQSSSVDLQNPLQNRYNQYNKYEKSQQVYIPKPTASWQQKQEQAINKKRYLESSQYLDNKWDNYCFFSAKKKWNHQKYVSLYQEERRLANNTQDSHMKSCERERNHQRNYSQYHEHDDNDDQEYSTSIHNQNAQHKHEKQLQQMRYSHSQNFSQHMKKSNCNSFVENPGFYSEEDYNDEQLQFSENIDRFNKRIIPDIDTIKRKNINNSIYSSNDIQKVLKQEQQEQQQK